MRHLYSELTGQSNVATSRKLSFVPKLLFSLFGFGLLVLVIQLFTGVNLNTQASVPGIEESGWGENHTNSFGSTARTMLTLKNNRAETVTIQFKRETYWCAGAQPTGGEPALKCFEHGQSRWGPTMSLNPGQSQSYEVSQVVGGNGSCGSAQVDIYYKVNGSNAGGPFWGVAWREPCRVTPPPPPPSPSPLDCRSVSVAPSRQVAAGQTIRLEANVVGGQGRVTVDWSVATDGRDKGTLSSTRANPVLWTAPSVLSSAQNWTFTAMARDEAGRVDSSGCVNSVSFAPLIVKHKECVNQACRLISGPGQDRCRVDGDCRVVTHRVCQDLACRTVSGPGPNECRTDRDCIPFTHKVCERDACKVKVGPGRNECVTDDDCAPVTHRECFSEACVVRSGPGQNKCDSDEQCKRPTHRECRNEACQVVDGGGVDRCLSDSECRPVRVQNVVCDSLNVNPQTGNVPLTVWTTLSGHTENGGSVVSYKFNFGDGTGDLMQSGQTLSHVFNSVGTFVVNGYVIDDRASQAGGSGSCQKVVTISPVGVTPPPPTGKVLGAIPSTGAETVLIPAMFGTGALGWAIRKLFKS